MCKPWAWMDTWPARLFVATATHPLGLGRITISILELPLHNFLHTPFQKPLALLGIEFPRECAASSLRSNSAGCHE